jgi:MYXO-CTERM domain-containing protein
VNASRARTTWLLASALFLFASDAIANGRFPAANMLVSRPGDPSQLLLRATYGLLVSHDGGGAWDWICERAVGYGGNEDPTVAIAGSGALVVAMFDGVARSTDGGCTWSRDPQGPRAVVDLALRPSAPDRLYAIRCLFANSTDAGGSLFHSELLVSEDAGVHWSTRAVLDPTLLLDTVEVAAGDPKRLYVSGARTEGRVMRGVLLVSDDDGAHFVEHPVPFAPDDRGVYVAAVAPDRADRVYARTSSPDASRLRVSDDGGKTWSLALDGGPLLGFALSVDGAQVYAGGPREGLRAAAASDLQFAPRSTLPIQCLTTVGATLWACAPTSAGFVLGASTNGGASFAPRLTLAGMRGPLRCPGSSAMEACKEDWVAFEQLVGGQREDASPSPAGPPVATHRSACGCSSPGAPSAPLSGGALLFLLLASFRRRRARLPPR